MKDFEEIEAKHQRTPVRLLDYGSATGVLRLKGDETQLHISSTENFSPSPLDENGWFSLRLETPEGNAILLHHAILTEDSTHMLSDRERTYSAQVYPNLVVDDLRGLTEEHRVGRILFRIRGLKNFFYYRHAEPLLGHELTDEQMAALRSMRSEHTLEDAEPFAPDRIYVMNELPKFISIRSDDRTYEVWASGRQSFGMHKFSAETFPTASISFDHPVTLDEALQRVWEWRIFFAEMAMLPLQLESISVQPSHELNKPMGDLYLPGATTYPSNENGHYKLHPAYLPLNQWEDRHQLADCMQRWLGQADARSSFRRRLYRVLENMNRRVDPRDLVDLASAVESLDEISGSNPLSREILSSMADAASRAAQEAEIAIDPKRIRGVLGSLQRPSLANRYTRMGEMLSPVVSTADAELLARSATRIRHATAHGGALDGEIQPRVSPTVQALTALCARFDLETSGVPTTSASDRAMTKIRFDHGLRDLRHIEAETGAITPEA